MSRTLLRTTFVQLILVGAGVLASATTMAADAVQLTIKDHRFAPSEVAVPANERIHIQVTNQDATPAEFESHDLRVEKIVPGGGSVTVITGPLKPGAYRFFDDYHPDTATGTLTAAEPQGRE
jgi:hypothetical protein